MKIIESQKVFKFLGLNVTDATAAAVEVRAFPRSLDVRFNQEYFGGRGALGDRLAQAIVKAALYRRCVPRSVKNLHGPVSVRVSGEHLVPQWLEMFPRPRPPAVAAVAVVAADPSSRISEVLWDGVTRVGTHMDYSTLVAWFESWVLKRWPGQDHIIYPEYSELGGLWTCKVTRRNSRN